MGSRLHTNSRHRSKDSRTSPIPRAKSGAFFYLSIPMQPFSPNTAARRSPMATTKEIRVRACRVKGPGRQRAARSGQISRMWASSAAVAGGNALRAANKPAGHERHPLQWLGRQRAARSRQIFAAIEGAFAQKRSPPKRASLQHLNERLRRLDKPVQLI